jgi:hypothetical protein
MTGFHADAFVFHQAADRSFLMYKDELFEGEAANIKIA